MRKIIKLDKKSAKKLIVEEKLKALFREHKTFQVINFKLESISRSHSGHLI